MTFKTTVVDSAGVGIMGLLVTANDEINGESYSRSTDGGGYADVAMLGSCKLGDRVTLSIIDPEMRFKGLVHGDSLVIGPADQVLTETLQPFKKPSSQLPAPPTRDEIIDVGITFQGLVYETVEFGKLPSFEACLPWLTPEDRKVVYAAKKASTRKGRTPNGDTHALLIIPDGPPLYDEPNQAYSADKFGPLDWTAGNTTIDPKMTALIREVLTSGFGKTLLYLGGDGGGDAYKIAFTQLELLHANEDFRTMLYKYCVVIPGWDGVFYGWPLEQIMNFGARFRELFPDGHLGLHYSTGHIPVGEGGDDYKPRPSADWDIHKNPGRMADYDVLIGEFDDNLHQDSTWQILNRLEIDYRRPPDQPAADDPNRVFYLGVPSARGRWGHCAMEYGEYEAVRCGTAFEGMVKHVEANREYMYSMNAKFPG